MLIIDADEGQALSRGRRAGQRTLAAPEDLLDRFGLDPAAADLEERPDDRADHVAEEPRRLDGVDDLVAAPAQLRTGDGPDGGAVAVRGKGGEIGRSDEHPGRLTHLADPQGIGPVEDRVALERVRL